MRVRCCLLLCLGFLLFLLSVRSSTSQERVRIRPVSSLRSKLSAASSRVTTERSAGDDDEEETNSARSVLRSRVPLALAARRKLTSSRVRFGAPASAATSTERSTTTTTAPVVGPTPVPSRTRLKDRKDLLSALKKKNKVVLKNFVAVPAVPDNAEEKEDAKEDDDGEDEDKSETSSVRSSKRIIGGNSKESADDSDGKKSAQEGDNKNGKTLNRQMFSTKQLLEIFQITYADIPDLG